jgi:hypothetical protein
VWKAFIEGEFAVGRMARRHADATEELGERMATCRRRPARGLDMLLGSSSFMVRALSRYLGGNSPTFDATVFVTWW